MALFTTNPIETVTIGEAAASRIPTAELIGPVDGAVDVASDTAIAINLAQGDLTSPVVTVNGAVVFRGGHPRLGWVATRVAVGETALLTMKPPVGFAYGSTVEVNVIFEPVS